VSKTHIPVDLKPPALHITTSLDDEATLVSSGGTHKIYKIFPEKRTQNLLNHSVKPFLEVEIQRYLSKQLKR
jgi:hypothetical protein